MNNFPCYTSFDGDGRNTENVNLVSHARIVFVAIAVDVVATVARLFPCWQWIESVRIEGSHLNVTIYFAFALSFASTEWLLCAVFNWTIIFVCSVSRIVKKKYRTTMTRKGTSKREKAKKKLKKKTKLKQSASSPLTLSVFRLHDGLSELCRYIDDERQQSTPRENSSRRATSDDYSTRGISSVDAIQWWTIRFSVVAAFFLISFYAPHSCREWQLLVPFYGRDVRTPHTKPYPKRPCRNVLLNENFN